MANKTIIAKLGKVDGNDCLSFNLSEQKSIKINLNDDVQENLKQLFYALIQEMFDDNSLSIILEFEGNYDQNNIFSNVSREYISALNQEISKIEVIIPAELIKNDSAQ